MRVTVVGLGIMGTGIARAVAMAGIPALLLDTRENRAEDAKREIVEALDRRGHPAAENARNSLMPVATFADAAKCDFLIEAIHEDFDGKSALLKSFDKLLSPATVMASNTSSLSLAELARGLRHPGRFVGLHFFVPAHANRLVEVGQAPETFSETVAATVEFARRLGKEPLTCRDAPGFITNRFYLPLINEAMRIVEEGLLNTAEADAAAMEAFDLSIGPFAVCRMGKLSTTLAAVRGLSPLGRFYEPCDALVDRGTFERQWPADEHGKHFSPPSELVERFRAAVFFAVLDALDDEVAEPSAFDKAAQIGLRFGRPPFLLMEELGREAVETRVAELAGRFGARAPKSIARIGGLVDVAHD